MENFIHIERTDAPNGIKKAENAAALLFCTAGTASLCCHEQTLPLQAHTLCLLCAADAPQLHPSKDFAAFLLQFSPDVGAHPLLSALLSPFSQGTTALVLDGENAVFFATVMGDMANFPADTPHLTARLFARLLDLLAVCAPLFPTPQRREPPRTPHRIPEAVMRYVEQNISRPISLDDIAGALFISKYHISHVFKRETGISVGEAVLRKKVEHADRLLAAGAPAHRASEMVGFNYYSAFFRIYKRIKGHAPTEA